MKLLWAFSLVAVKLPWTLLTKKELQYYILYD